MEVVLTSQQLPQAWETVKKWNLGPSSHYMEGCLFAEINYPTGFSFTVDEWPDFSILMHSAGQDYNLTYFAEIMSFRAKDGANVKEFLQNTKQLTRKKLIIGNCPLEHEEIYKELIEQWNAEVRYSTPLYHLEADLDSLQPCVLPHSYTLCELQESDAEFISSQWEYGDDSSIEFVRYHIRSLPNVAVKDKDGNLVAWEITYFTAAMGMLYVMKDHRGRGLAKFVIYELSKKLLEQGLPAYCYIEHQNKASVDLHFKCGFSIQEGHDVYFAMLKRN